LRHKKEQIIECTKIKFLIHKSLKKICVVLNNLEKLIQQMHFSTKQIPTNQISFVAICLVCLRSLKTIVYYKRITHFKLCKWFYSGFKGKKGGGGGIRGEASQLTNQYMGTSWTYLSTSNSLSLSLSFFLFKHTHSLTQFLKHAHALSLSCSSLYTIYFVQSVQLISALSSVCLSMFLPLYLYRLTHTSYSFLSDGLGLT